MFAERVDLLSTILVNFNIGASGATVFLGTKIPGANDVPLATRLTQS
jgi:hypothetical protein